MESVVWAVLGSAPPGLTLRFIEQGRFGIGIVLHNASGRTVTVVDARTPEPPRSLVSQVGTRLVAWNPPPCGGGRGCLAYVFLRSSFVALRPTPLSVVAAQRLRAQPDTPFETFERMPFS